MRALPTPLTTQWCNGNIRGSDPRDDGSNPSWVACAKSNDRIIVIRVASVPRPPKKILTTSTLNRRI